jgi:hypothetical protein
MGLLQGAECLSRTLSFAHIRHQCHESRSFDGVFDGALKGGAVAAAFAAEDLALVRAQFLERLHVLVIDERGSRAALLRAKPATILPTPSKLLADHGNIPLGKAKQLQI